MNWQYTPYAAVLILTAGISAMVASVAWRRRSMPGGRPLALLMLAVTEWSIAAAIEASAVEPSVKILWSKIEYVGVTSGPTLFLIFALEYSRQDKWLTRRNVALLWIMPIITLVMAATNEWHGLVWSHFTPGPNGSNILVYGHGAWFWAAVVYFYLSVFAGTLALVRAAVRSPDLYRRQAVSLLIGSALIWAGSAIYVFGLSPIPGLDTTPVGFMLTGLILAWGIFRLQLFDLVPVARDILIESMRDGVLVLDAQNRIVDINPAARQLFGVDTTLVIGQHAEVTLAAWPDLVAHLRDVQETRAEILLGKDSPCCLDVRISPLYDQRRLFTGRLIILRDISERKQAEKELADTKALLEAAFEQTPSPMVLVSAPDRAIRIVNSACRDFLGIQDEPSYVGTLLFEMKQTWQDFDRDGRPVTIDELPLARALAGMITRNKEFSVRRKDGTHRWELVSAAPIYNRSGELIAGFAIFPDITQRKQAEAELQASQARLRAMFDNAGVAVLLTDMEDRYIECNDRWANMLGYSLGEFYQVRDEDIIHPDDVAAIRERRQALVRRQIDGYQLEKRFIRKDGSVFWGRLSVTPIRKQDGTIEATIGIVNDMTGRKQAEQQLAEALDLNQAIISASSFGFLAYKASGVCMLANKAAARTVNATVEQLLKQNFRQIASWKQSGLLKMAEETLTTGSPQRGDFHLVTTFGKEIWLDSYFTPFISGGEPHLLLIINDITERKRTEEALAHERKLLRTMIDIMPDTIYVKDAQSRFLVGNIELAHKLGAVTPEEIIGKSDVDFHPPELAAQYYADEQAILRSGQSLINREEMVLDRATGKLFWNSATKVPMRDTQGKLIGLVGIGRDITERKRAEDELKRLKEFNESIIQSMAEGIAVEDAQGRYTFVNPAAARMLAYTPGELVGQHWTTVVLPDQWPIVQAANDRRARGEADWYELDLVRKDGLRLTVLISGSPVFDAITGHLTGTLAVFTDITERKRAEQAEHEQRMLAEALRDTAAALNSTLDLDEVLARILSNIGRVVPHDSADVMLIDPVQGVAYIARFAGYDRMAPELEASVLDLRFPVVETANLRQMFETRLPCLVDDVQAFDWITTPQTSWIRSHLGAPIQVKGSVVGFLNVASSTPHFFTRSQAVRLQAFADQASLAIQNAHLYAEARQHAQELEQANQQAQEARNAAEAANRAKSAFLANMSHELRTPLNAILGFSSLMARDPELLADQRENLAIINRSGEHLLGLINDVLDMAKIESGRLTLQEHTFDLHRMLDGLIEMFRLRAVEKGLTLIVDRAPDVPRYIRADENKLRQVLINLLGNAVKFTDEGGIGLRVYLFSILPSVAVSGREEKEGRLQFEVQDTGPGMAPQELEAVFEPFVQSTSGYKSQEGTGLGLPISRQFVYLMGGDLTASSSGVPGLGTLFTFNVHVGLASGSDLAGVERPVSARALGLESGQPAYRLLVAEDRLESRQLLVKLLTQFGFDVRAAANGLEAVRAWQDWQPHLIWMDLRMPVMDGHEATQRIKAAPQGQAPIIIAISASAFEDQRAMVLSEGCDDFVSKPFREEEIVDRLVKHLGVRFRYESATGGESPLARPSPAGQPQQALNLEGVSPEWVAELQRAAVEANSSKIEALVSQIREQHPVLASALTEAVAGFDYDAILNVLHDRNQQEG